MNILPKSICDVMADNFARAHGDLPEGTHVVMKEVRGEATRDDPLAFGYLGYVMHLEVIETGKCHPKCQTCFDSKPLMNLLPNGQMN